MRPTISRIALPDRICIRAGMVLCVFLFSGIHLAGAQTDGITLESASGDSLRATAGSVGTIVFRIINESTEILDGRGVPELPIGWTTLFPDARNRVLPGTASTQLVSFRIPARTPTGTYVVRFRVERKTGQPAGHADVTVTILPRYGLDIQVIERPDYVPAGESYRIRYSVVNTGNTTESLDVRPVSSLGYGVTIDSGSARRNVAGGHAEGGNVAGGNAQGGNAEGGNVAGRKAETGAGKTVGDQTSVMAPGETLEITVVSKTTNAIKISLIHQVQLVASIRESPKKTYSASATTELIPRASTIMPTDPGGIPVIVSASGFSEKGHTSQQLEVEVTDAEIGRKKLSLLIRAPDARAFSAYGPRDRYTMSLDAPRWNVKLGDHSYTLTELTETGRTGMGGGGSARIGRISVGGYAHRSRHVFPIQTQWAASTSWAASDRFDLGLAFLEKRDFEDGRIVSGTTRLKPVSGTELSAEYARGFFDGATDDAVSAEIVSEGAFWNVSGRVMQAGQDFLGAVQNLDAASFAGNLSLNNWLQIQGQYRGRRRNYSVSSTVRLHQTHSFVRGGAVISRTRKRRRLWMMAFARLQRQSMPPVSFSSPFSGSRLISPQRRERAVELRAGLNVRRGGMTLQYHTGQTSDLVTGGNDRFWRADISVFANANHLSFSAAADLINGPTFYNPVAQERATIAASVTAEPTADLRVSINAFYSRDRLTPDLEFRQMDARTSYRFPFGHELIADVRIASTGADRNIQTASGGFTYRIPLSLNVLSRVDTNVITGQIYDVETGLGIANAVVSLGRTTVITDNRGRYRLPKPVRGTEYLSVDRRTTGLDRIPLIELPYAVSADGTIQDALDIGFVQASSVEIAVTYHTSDRANRTSALGKKLKAGPQRGLLVELTNGGRRLRRVTNSAGRVTFSDLIPGEWEAFIVGSRIPVGYRAEPDTLYLSIDAGTRTKKTIRIRPANKEIILVGGQVSVSLRQKIEMPAEEEAPPVRAADVGLPDDSLVVDRKPRSGQNQTHVVEAGEHLASIARVHYGSPIYWVRIWLANEETVFDPDLISPDQVLVLPPPGPLTKAELRTLREFAR